MWNKRLQLKGEAETPEETYSNTLPCPEKSKLLRIIGDAGWTLVDGYFPVTKISFNHGLLSETKNSFELLVEENCQGFQVVHPSWFTPEDKPGVRLTVSKVEIHLLHEGLETHSDTAYFISFKNTTHQYLCWAGKNVWNEETDGIRVSITVKSEEYADFSVPENPEKIEDESAGSGSREYIFVTAPPGAIDITTYFLSSALSDITINCQGFSFPGHRFVFREKCPSFSYMLDAEDGSGDWLPAKKAILECPPNVELDVMMEFLRFLYTGTVQSQLQDIWINVYELATYFGADELTAVCLKLILDQLNSDNALNAYVLAKEYMVPELAQAARGVLAATPYSFDSDYSSADLEGDPESDDSSRTYTIETDYMSNIESDSYCPRHPDSDAVPVFPSYNSA